MAKHDRTHQKIYSHVSVLTKNVTDTNTYRIPSILSLFYGNHGKYTNRLYTRSINRCTIKRVGFLFFLTQGKLQGRVVYAKAYRQAVPYNE